MCPACYVIVADSQSAAEEKRAYIARWPSRWTALVLLSEVLNFDFAPRTWTPSSPTRSCAAVLAAASATGWSRSAASPTRRVRDFVHFSGRGTIGEFPIFCGTPAAVADQMEEWFTGRACDGFVLAATHTPGAYEDFARLRGARAAAPRPVPHATTPATTLRENLGLPRPSAADCRAAARA